MTDTQKSAQTNKIARGRDDETTITPALRHVGKTLESDPNYFDSEGDGLTPEAQIANVGAPPDTTMGRGATDPSADVSSTDDLAKATRDMRPEPLKTRLPGDTSSDPHTDAGPDNATTVQHRGER
jgi:hypothetical protein